MKKNINISSGTRGITAVVLMLVLFSIASGCGRSKPSRFYTLREIAADGVTMKSSDLKTDDNDTSIIGISVVSIPGYINHNKIVTRIDSAEVAVSEYNRWAEPVDDKLSEVISGNLSRLCSSAKVFTYSTKKSSSFTSYIEVNISELVADSAGKVTLDAEYIISPLADKKAKEVNKRVRLDKPYKVGDYNDMVSVMSSLLADFCRDIAKEVDKQ